MKPMLFCATLALILAVVQCDANFHQAMQQCMQETKVTEAELKEFMAKGMQGTPSENFKCYTKCLMEKQGHMTNGQFNAQALLNSLKNVPQMKENLDEITSGVNACQAKKGANDCETAYLVTMCLKEQKAAAAH